jgi:hypothetical protein
MDSINEAQEIQFRRLELCDYIGGDCRTSGKKVADDLRKHMNLWDSFVFGRFDRGQLIELRDLPTGTLNADTLYILTTLDRKDELLALVEAWKPDSCWATENKGNGSDSSPHARYVAEMMGTGPSRFHDSDLVAVRVWCRANARGVLNWAS